MPVLLNRHDDDATTELEQRALEKMVTALCADVERLVRAARSRGALESREAHLQSQAFDERRAQASKLLEDPAAEPGEMRITRLEKMVEALTSSRNYFRAFE